MKYENAISNLNSLNSDELNVKIEKLKSRNIEYFDETVGMLFSALRKVKSEEFYRVIKFGDSQPKSYDDIFFDDGSKYGRDYAMLCNNPIIPFLSEEIKEGDKLSLLTYRKFSDEDMSAIMADGFYEKQNVFEILKNDGFSEKGWNNYIAICKFVHNEFIKKKKDYFLLNKIKEMYCDEDEIKALIYLDGSTEYGIFKNTVFEKYYSCTSLIFCRLLSIENGGERVVIEPLLHNSEKILHGEDIEYDDFGEVGNFAFEMNDYE